MGGPFAFLTSLPCPFNQPESIPPPPLHLPDHRRRTIAVIDPRVVNAAQGGQEILLLGCVNITMSLNFKGLLAKCNLV